jgi:hypothetical protein
VFDKPDAVRGDEKEVPVGAHLRGIDHQHGKRVVSRPDLDGGCGVRGEVDGVPGHFLKAVAENRLDVPFGRRFGGFELQINRDGLALIRPDPGAGAVELEPLLVARTDELTGIVHRDGPPARHGGPPRRGDW